MSRRMPPPPPPPPHAIPGRGRSRSPPPLHEERFRHEVRDAGRFRSESRSPYDNRRGDEGLPPPPPPPPPPEYPPHLAHGYEGRSFHDELPPREERFYDREPMNFAPRERVHRHGRRARDDRRDIGSRLGKRIEDRLGPSINERLGSRGAINQRLGGRRPERPAKFKVNGPVAGGRTRDEGGNGRNWFAKTVQDDGDGSGSDRGVRGNGGRGGSRGGRGNGRERRDRDGPRRTFDLDRPAQGESDVTRDVISYDDDVADGAAPGGTLMDV